MWSLTSPRAKRISGLKKFRSSVEKDFCNSIGAKRTFAKHRRLLSTDVGTGAIDVTLECLPSSTLLAELRTAGYDVTEIGEIERILPTAILERSTMRADGELEPVTAGSTGRGDQDACRHL
jgi:hypothetical protein